MHLLFVFLADAAQVVNGKLYVMGGAWDRLHPHVLAGVHTSCLVIGLAVEREATNVKHRLAINLIAGGTATQIQAGEFEVRRAEADGSRQHTFLMAAPVQLPLSHQGEHTIKLLVDEHEVGAMLYTVTPALAQRLGMAQA